MFEFLTASQNLPFTVALAVMFGIALLEGVASLIGASLSNAIDSMLPEVDMDADLDASEIRAPNALSKLLSWFRIGRVPVLMLLIVFLTSFGLIGLGIQKIAFGLVGSLLPSWIAVVPAVFCSLPFVRVFGGLFEKFLPKDETEAVSDNSFVGRVATITLGLATHGSAAEAKLKDEFGASHYLMVEPDVETESFSQGDQVLIVKKQGAVFRAIKNTNEALVG
ncbi:MAG: YqiJ family protein [Gammaproteobacteria bacterium]|nr:YqiJ family protein [Gammaproteobacteria bacterium]